jgi:vacuolar-type H+-ATPase subunit E/Vma4
MALEDILKKISEDARAEADSLVSVSRAEAESLREKARKEAETLRAGLMRKAKERAENHADRVKVLAGLDQRKEILKEKKRLLDETFEQARKRLLNLSPGEYLAFLKPLILKTVESGNEEIIPSAAQKNLFTPDFLKSLNDALGIEKGHLRLSGESGNFSGGFILREGNRETNMTLESLIDSQRDTLEPQIARTLFGEKRQHG